MKWPLAITLTLLLIVAAIVLTAATGFNAMLIVVIVTAVWGAVDSAKLELKRYKSMISQGPVMLFLGIVVLWIIIFPWYLVMRERIKSGQATLKE